MLPVDGSDGSLDVHLVRLPILRSILSPRRLVRGCWRTSAPRRRPHRRGPRLAPHRLVGTARPDQPRMPALYEFIYAVSVSYLACLATSV